MITFFKNLQAERAWESTKLFFAAVGGFGFAGYVSAMKLYMAIPAILGGIASWYLIYRVTEVSK